MRKSNSVATWFVRRKEKKEKKEREEAGKKEKREREKGNSFVEMEIVSNDDDDYDG